MKGLLTILERLGIKRPLPFLKRWQRKQQSIRCKTEYLADDGSAHSSTHSSTNPKHSTKSSKHYFRFVLTLLGSGYHKYVLGRDYAHHAKMAKELKERNEDIYNTVMVGIRQYQSLSACNKRLVGTYKTVPSSKALKHLISTWCCFIIMVQLAVYIGRRFHILHVSKPLLNRDKGPHLSCCSTNHFQYVTS